MLNWLREMGLACAEHVAVDTMTLEDLAGEGGAEGLAKQGDMGNTKNSYVGWWRRCASGSNVKRNRT